MFNKSVLALSILFQCGLSAAKEITHYSYESCIAIDGYVPSLDFSLTFPEVEELMFSLPTPSTPQRKKARPYYHPQNDLGISKNANVNKIFFTRNIRSACFLKFASMPNVKEFSFIVNDDLVVNWLEISQAFQSLEMISIDFREALLSYVDVAAHFHGLENVLSAKRLKLSLDDKSVAIVLTTETLNMLAELGQLEEINIYISRLKKDVNDDLFAKAYQELLQTKLPNAKINVENITVYDLF